MERCGLGSNPVVPSSEHAFGGPSPFAPQTAWKPGPMLRVASARSVTTPGKTGSDFWSGLWRRCPETGPEALPRRSCCCQATKPLLAGFGVLHALAEQDGAEHKTKPEWGVRQASLVTSDRLTTQPHSAARRQPHLKLHGPT